MTRDINELNERISRFSGRDPDKNLNKSWGDWLSTATVVLEMQDKEKKQKKG